MKCAFGETALYFYPTSPKTSAFVFVQTANAHWGCVYNLMLVRLEGLGALPVPSCGSRACRACSRWVWGGLRLTGGGRVVCVCSEPFLALFHHLALHLL